LVGPIYIIFLLGLSFTGFTFQNALLLALVISMVGLLFSFYSLIGIAVFITASLWVVPYFIPMPSLIKFSDLAYASIILAIESLLLVMASRSLQRSFAEADRSTQALLHTNRDLQELSKTLEQRVAERTRALATSSEVSRRLANIFDQKKLVDEVVNQVNDAFGYYHTQIYFFDPDKEHLVLAGGTGEAGDRMMAQFHKIKKGRGLVGRAADSNKMVLVTDTSKNREWLPNPLLPRTESEVAVPISIGDEVLGVLDVQHDVANSLKQEDVDSLQSVANQVAVALQNIRQYENSRKIASDMSVVASVGIATSTITDSQILLREMVEFTKKSFNLYHAHIYLLNEENNMLELAAGAGEVGQQMVAEKTSIPLNSEQSLVARAARSREGVVVNDVTLSSDFLANPLLPDTRAEMAVPMIAADKVIGVLDVQSEIVGHFTDVDVSIKTTLASQIAIALQNAKTLVDAQRQAERETRVNLITKKIQSTTSVEAALQITARELGHALGMRQTMVELDSTALDNDRKGKRS
jgi:putative methionine-R-sulfoxide reductase with GAF domain